MNPSLTEALKTCLKLEILKQSHWQQKDQQKSRQIRGAQTENKSHQQHKSDPLQQNAHENSHQNGQEKKTSKKSNRQNQRWPILRYGKD